MKYSRKYPTKKVAAHSEVMGIVLWAGVGGHLKSLHY